ncbi:hypothetical protein IFR05_002005 [Cadophora sp. M221]|nr:hypothetical protein IFR05_002005 [Cadophora sp. M221]
MSSANSNGPVLPSFVGPFHPRRRFNTRTIVIDNFTPEPEPQPNSVTSRPRPRALDNDRGSALLDLLSAPQPIIDIEARMRRDRLLEVLSAPRSNIDIESIRARELLFGGLGIDSQPRPTMLKIRHSTDNFPQTVYLHSLTLPMLNAICVNAIAPDPIGEIYYWTPRYRCWTEVKTSCNLELMKATFRDANRAHAFILRKRVGLFRSSEKVADLPFMRTDGFLLGDMVPVEGRRGSFFVSHSGGSEINFTQ